jgi:uncharacterized DUF497 family protein
MSDIEFDADKDAANLVKHGVSLRRAADLEILARVWDARYAEPRLRAYGMLDGLPYCLAFTAVRGTIRAISLRRAHLKEFRRYVETE